MTKRTGMIAAAAAAFMALGAFGSAAAQDKPITIRVGEYYPVSHTIAKIGIIPFMKAVEERSKGRIKFEFFPGEQAGKGADLPNLIGSGVVDMGLVVPGYLPAKMPLGDVIALPGLYSDPCVGARTYNAIMQPDQTLGKEEMSRNGLRTLFTLAVPPFELWLTKEITSLKDVKGMKIRVATSVQDMVARELGAVPIRMSGAEIHDAFSRGTVDGGIFAVATVASWNIAPMIKSATRDAHVSGFAPMYAINEKRWAALPKDIQAILTEESDKITRNGCKTLADESAALNTQLEKQGVKFLSVSDSDAETMKRIYKTVAERWVTDLEQRSKPAKAVLQSWETEAGKL